eukprot:TRINITY_DN52577_c0_g1_i1.p1 TRINITY_DN52577_c0_g1~~TRINITY_DN52577_c0_g1_i1.p1  ORF type:complete len:183 (-),score=48.01 TRINITY_DN52577_c0_g1_i1:46-516(-)
MADEVLRTHEDLVMLDRQKNGRREALGCFRRGELKGQSQWIASEGQFLKLPTDTMRNWLQKRQADVDAEITAGRSLFKLQTQELLKENPHISELNPGVCDLLLSEQKKAKDGEDENSAENKAKAAAAKTEREEKRKANTLDYSRFDRIADSDEEGT